MEPKKRRKLSSGRFSSETEASNSASTISPNDWGKFSFGDSPMVQLKVGHKETRFHVHQNLLCHASSFFEAALTGKFKESSGFMELVEDDADTFENLLEWLYRRKFETLSDVEATLPSFQMLLSIDDVDTRWAIIKKHEHHYIKLTQLYIFADKYDIGAAQEQCHGSALRLL